MAPPNQVRIWALRPRPHGWRKAPWYWGDSLGFYGNFIWLVILTILKNMKVNGKDYPIYYGKIKNVWNHQPVMVFLPDWMGIQWISGILGRFGRSVWKKSLNIRFKERNYNNSRNTCHLPNVANYIYVFPLCIPMFGWFYHSFLVGGWPTPLKNMSSSVGMIIPNWMEKKNKSSKPPTSFFSFSKRDGNDM